MSHLHEAERLSEPFSLDTREGQAVRDLLEVLAKYGDRMSDKTAELMSHSLLEATADHLRNSGIEMPRRQKLVDRRLSDIENYIKMNLADPELSYDKVAISCGISPVSCIFLALLISSRRMAMIMASVWPRCSLGRSMIAPMLS